MNFNNLFTVYVASDTRTEKIKRFDVIDAAPTQATKIGYGPDDDGYYPIVSFHINARFDEDEQRIRAEDYCSYLNKLKEAARKTYEQTLLVDQLKR